MKLTSVKAIIFISSCLLGAISDTYATYEYGFVGKVDSYWNTDGNWVIIDQTDWTREDFEGIPTSDDLITLEHSVILNSDVTTPTLMTSYGTATTVVNIEEGYALTLNSGGTGSSNDVISMRGNTKNESGHNEILEFESGNINIIKIGAPGTSTPNSPTYIRLNSNGEEGTYTKNMIFGANATVNSTEDLSFVGLTKNSSIVDFNGAFTAEYESIGRSVTFQNITSNVNFGATLNIGRLQLISSTLNIDGILNVNGANTPDAASGNALKDATMVINAASSVQLNGTLNLTGAKDKENIVLYGSFTIGKDGVLNMSGGYGTLQVFEGGVLTVNSGKDTLEVEGCLRLWGGGKIIFNSTDAYYGDFNSNRTNGIWMSSDTVNETKMAYLEINADNHLGGLCFGRTVEGINKPKLTLTLGETEGLLLELDYLTVSMDTNDGYLCDNAVLNIENFRNYTIKLLYGLRDENSLGVKDDLSLITADGYENFYLEEIEGGGYWLNAHPIPEPSAAVLIFGIAAIGAVAIRRRQK